MWPLLRSANASLAVIADAIIPTATVAITIAIITDLFTNLWYISNVYKIMVGAIT
jgi:hypothetical protein